MFFKNKSKNPPMKKIFPQLIVLVFIVSCSKSDTSPETVITESSMSDFRAGKTVAFFNVNNTATPLQVPQAGDKQEWDFSNLAVKDTVSIRYLSPVINDSFPTANNMLAVTERFGTATSASNLYGELSSSGFASLGKDIGQISITNGGANLTLPAQTIKLSQKIYSANFPMRYRDSLGATGIKERYKLLVTVPMLYPTNTPGTETITTSYSNTVIASGKMKLKGYDNDMPVLVVRNRSNSVVNYLVNGAVPPAPVLAAANTSEGEKMSSVTYSFYSPVIGYAGSIYLDSNNVVTGGTFRRKF
jgi:hypothetical protein